MRSAASPDAGPASTIIVGPWKSRRLATQPSAVDAMRPTRLYGPSGLLSSGENYAGAGGPMQFLQSTFHGVVGRHALPAGGATPPSRYNPHDAIYAAAYYLCDSGAPKDLRKAIFAYNHADWYVDEVLAQAKKYGDALVGTGDCKNIQAPTPAAIMAINFACGQLGRPYQWDGNGPAQGDKGFDCSGFTMAAYNAAGISLPRTAQTQYNAGPLVPAGQPLLPGDLVFCGTPVNVHHVGLYIGAGKMMHAPDFGQPIQVSQYRWNGDDYLAASRPVVDSRVVVSAPIRAFPRVPEQRVSICSACCGRSERWFPMVTAFVRCVVDGWPLGVLRLRCGSGRHPRPLSPA